MAANMCNLQQLKNRSFHVPQPTFLFLLETPLRLSRNICMDGKTIQCLPNPSQHVGLPICLQQFPSYTMLKSMRKSKNRYFLPHFGFYWGPPWGNHAKCCMDGKRIQCSQIVLQHVPIYRQQFPSYSNCKCKKLPFSRTAAHIFVSPGDAPATITQYVAWMERQFNACQTLAACTYYLQQFPSYTMLKSMRKSKNRYFYHIFVSPGDAPGAVTLDVVCMEREFDAYKLSRSM